MANAAVDVGTGATIAFATSSIAVNMTSLSLGEHTIPIVDTTHLGSTGFRTMMGGDLKTPGEVTCEFIWDNEAGPAVTATAETVTITFPTAVANTTSAATYIGTGIVSTVVYPTLGIDELQTGSLTVTWNGGTGPTYTNGV